MSGHDEAPSAATGRQKARRATFTEDQQLYRPLSKEQDREQTNSHYEQPVEFFSTLTGGAISLSTGILISGAVVLGYTIWGGMWSVAMTDLFQSVMIIVGLSAIAVLVVLCVMSKMSPI